MSAPRTNIASQLRHHRGPVIGIVVIIVVVLLGFVWWIHDEADDPAMPGDTPVEEMTVPPETGTTAAPATEATTQPETQAAPAGDGG